VTDIKTADPAATTGTAPAESISRRELKILAGISLGTIILMALLAEVATRVVYREKETDGCRRAHQVRPVAGCSGTSKGAEAPWITNAYNECGYRSAHSCGPKPAGTRRIVALGKSVSAGDKVPYDEYFGARLERALQSHCGFATETQSLGSLMVTTDRQGILVAEALSLKPDVAILPLSPSDLTYFAHDPEPEAETAAAAPAATNGAPSLTPLPQHREAQNYSLVTRLRLLSRESRALLTAQHFMLMNDDFLIRAYRLQQEEDALRLPHSAAYQLRYTRLEAVLRDLSTRLAAGGVPLVVVSIPNRIQAALISHRIALPGVDPWAFTRELRAIAGRTGVRFADTFPRFAAHPHAERLFYAVEGHPTGEAHAVIAEALEQTLTDGIAVPAFRGCRIPE
jgi:hypothetical protein